MPETLQHVLSAIGNAVLNSFWQMGLLWLIVTAITKFHKTVSPATLTIISFWGLVTGFIAFAITFIVSLITPNVDTGILGWLATPDMLYNVIEYAAILYIVVLIVPFVRLCKGLNNVHILKTSGLERIPGSIKIFFSDAVSYLNIKRTVKIYASHIIESPLTVGFLKPVILIPVALLNHLSTHQIEAIILHELSHIKNNDYFRNLISQIILAILYFNPFAKALANIQKLEREKAADTIVTQFEYNNYMYANTLLQLARQNAFNTTALTIEASGVKKPSALLQRIQYIMGSNDRVFPSAKKVVFAFALLFIALTVSVLNKPVNTSLSNLSDELISVGPMAHYRFMSGFDGSVDTELHTGKQNTVTNNNLKNAGPSNTSTFSNSNRCTKKENGEHIEPEASSSEDLVSFVSNVEPSVPELSTSDEYKIQGSISAAKKVVAEATWKSIDNELAETVTSNQRMALKDTYLQAIQSADWKKQEELLRIHFNNINWDEVSNKLNNTLVQIKLDSIYENIQRQIEMVEVHRQKLAHDSLTTKIELYKQILKKVDAIRSKKIVEL